MKKSVFKKQIVFLISAVVVQIIICFAYYSIGSLSAKVLNAQRFISWYKIDESTLALYEYLKPIVDNVALVLDVGIFIYAISLAIKKILPKWSYIGIALIGICYIANSVMNHIPSELLVNSEYYNEANRWNMDITLHTDLYIAVAKIRIVLEYISILGILIILCSTSLSKKIKWILCSGWILGEIIIGVLSEFYARLSIYDYAYYACGTVYLYYNILYFIALCILIFLYYKGQKFVKFRIN